MKLTKKIIVISLIPLFMLFLGSLVSSHFLKKSHDITENYIANDAAKQLILYDIYRNLGYVGGIHEFKNYILRFDKYYENTSREHFQQVRILIAQYLNYENNSSLEIESLKILDQTIEKYAAMIDVAAKAMENSSATPVSVDKLVKVDDGPARKALSELHEFFVKNRQNKLNQLQDANQLSLTISIISYLLALLVSLILSQFKANKIIESLKSLTKISKDVSEGKFFIENEHIDPMPDDEIKDVAFQMKDMGHKLEYTFNNLRDFAHVAAHDLQAPAKKIAAYTDLLEMECGEHLNENSRRYITNLRDSATWMVELIKKLLKFSEINFLNAEVAEVDLNYAIEDSLNNLEVVIAEVKPKFNIENLPVVLGNEILLKSLFQNIISNALKFRNKEVPLKIRVRAQKIDNQYWEISFNDNGIGFDMSKLNTIMRPFGRLHSKEEYTGFGIGLATCKKITEAHNGKFDIRSNPDEGTTVTITLKGA